jgi:hypothetical protein
MDDMWICTGQWRVVDRPEYALIVDDWHNESAGDAQMTFLHCDVHIWAPSVLKDIQRDVKLLRACVRGPIYATGTITNNKWVRFVKLFGFEHLIDYGNGRKMFILKDDNGQLCYEHPTTV